MTTTPESVTLRDYVEARMNGIELQSKERRDAVAAMMVSQFVDLRLMLDERYATQVKAVDAAFLAQQTAMSTALAAADRAVGTAMTAAEKATAKAEIAADKRFDAVNEFRAQLADQAATFMPRGEADTRLRAMSDRVGADAERSNVRHAELETRLVRAMTELTSRVDMAAGRSTGVSASWGYLIGAVGLIGGIVALVLRV